MAAGGRGCCTFTYLRSLLGPGAAGVARPKKEGPGVGGGCEGSQGGDRALGRAECGRATEQAQRSGPSRKSLPSRSSQQTHKHTRTHTDTHTALASPSGPASCPESLAMGAPARRDGAADDRHPESDMSGTVTGSWVTLPGLPAAPSPASRPGAHPGIRIRPPEPGACENTPRALRPRSPQRLGGLLITLPAWVSGLAGVTDGHRPA